MAGFNLIRKRRRRLPWTKILLGILGLAVVAGGVQIGLKMRSGGGILGYRELADITISDAGVMLAFQDVKEGPTYEYTASVDNQDLPRGAVVSFSVIARDNVQATVTLDDFALVVKSFTPLDKLPAPKTYEPPIARFVPPDTEDDATVRLSFTDKAKASITWSTGTVFTAPEGTREVVAGPPAKDGSQQFDLLGSPAQIPLSSLNRPTVKFFNVRVVLDTPGVATLGLVARTEAEGAKASAATKETFTIVYNPDSDAGSIAFFRRAYESDPTFLNARILRDKLLEFRLLDDAVKAAVTHRNREPGADADWLVGSTYRELGERESDAAKKTELFQKAACDGLLAFYRQDKDFVGDRLQRWQTAKDWLTTKVQEKVISLNCP